MKFVVSLVAIALVGSVIFVVLLEVVVSGGEGNAQDQARGAGAEQSDRDKTGEEKAEKEAENLEWASGTVLKAAPDKRALVVRPDDGERQLFTYKPENIEVMLDGEKAGPDAIDEGQRLRVGYKEVRTNKDREVRVARSIMLESKNGSPGGESSS